MDTPLIPTIPDRSLWSSSDPLSEVLHLMRMSGMFYALSELTAPWGMEMPVIPDTMMFHFVTEGRCWLEIDELEPRLLEPGTLVLVPHGRGHRLVDEVGGPVVDLFSIPRQELSDRYELIRHGGGGAMTRLVCGAVYFDNPAARQFVDLLPRLICVDAWSATQVEWLHGTLRFMASEARQLQPGGETIITRLADVLVIQALRSWLAGEDPCDSSCGGNWLRAIQDPQIGQAIVQVHRNPASPWTVQELAASVGMSRSGFAARFKEVAGESPLQYVTRWRMLMATSRLQESDVTLGELSEQCGYQSEAAFSRAFKRAMGVSPGRMRREMRQGG